MPRPIIATVNLAALASNLITVRSYAPKAKVWTVVKANGYGHGLDLIWKGLQKTDGFALIDINEAILLREKGWKGAILLLEGFFHPTDLKEIDNYRLTTVIHSKWQIKSLKNMTPKNPLNVYIKLNSGMNRLGFDDQTFFYAWHTLKSLKHISTLTIMTHFANANENESIKKQMDKVTRISNILKMNIPFCLANSAAILWHPQTHKQWIRPGIILYGASPRGDWKDVNIKGLQTVMTLQSEIITIQKVNMGDQIGYGNYYHSKEEQLIGIVACGYADGYPRHAKTGTPILVDNIRTRIIGTISMDMLIVDLKFCPSARIGSKVELWGDRIKIDEVAMFANTISYELMSSLSSRVTKKIIDFL